jgi:hypothetical protein
VILTKFHNFDVWHKILKGYANLRAVYKKTVFDILIVPSKR